MNADGGKAVSRLPPRPVFPQGSSGIRISPFADHDILSEVRKVVEGFFSAATEDYVAMDADAYRRIIVAAQGELNQRETATRLAADRRDIICEVLDTTRPLIQTNLYLRATRPSIADVQENVGWHRESFYGPDMSQSINFWVPIANVSSENAVRYIPDSHLIPDDDIETTSKPDDTVKKFSAGHKIGLLYSPKEIVSGVDLGDPKPLEVLAGECAVFAGALIHGAAVNRSKQIRFSVDFRLIAAESLTCQRRFKIGPKGGVKRGQLIFG